MGGCGMNGDINHLSITCDFYGRIWSVVSRWIGFSTATQEALMDHLFQFGSLGGFSKHAQLTFNII